MVRLRARISVSSGVLADPDLHLRAAYEVSHVVQMILSPRGYLSRQALTRADVSRYKTANAAFFNDLTKWVFQETNVVKVVETSHKSNENGLEKAQYRKGEEIVSLRYVSTSKGGPGSGK